MYLTNVHAIVQGLHASMPVLDAELLSIDREQQIVRLSNGQSVLYGMLVITAGLDQIPDDMADQPRLSNNNVISLKAARNFTKEVCS